jgi:hypothetical protein
LLPNNLYEVQDDYRVRPRLAINLGLHDDLQPSLVDPQNRNLTFLPGHQSTVVPSALPGLLFPGDEGIPRRTLSGVAEERLLSPYEQL